MTPRPIRPRLCGICSHPERPRIEMARVGGASLDSVAKQFGVSRDSIFRHMRGHVSDRRRAEICIGPVAVADLANKAAEESRSLLDYLTIVRSVSFAAFLNAAEVNDRVGLAHLGGKLLDVLDRIGRLTGQLREIGSLTVNQQINIHADPRFISLQSGLLQIARGHPGARTDIVRLLRSLDNDEGPLARSAAPPLIEGTPVDAA